MVETSLEIVVHEMLYFLRKPCIKTIIDSRYRDQPIWRNVRKQECVFPLFSPDSVGRVSLNFHMFVILYTTCDTRSMGLWTICLPMLCDCFRGARVHNAISSLQMPHLWYNNKKS